MAEYVQKTVRKLEVVPMTYTICYSIYKDKRMNESLVNKHEKALMYIETEDEVNAAVQELQQEGFDPIEVTYRQGLGLYVISATRLIDNGGNLNND